MEHFLTSDCFYLVERLNLSSRYDSFQNATVLLSFKPVQKFVQFQVYFTEFRSGDAGEVFSSLKIQKYRALAWGFHMKGMI